MLINSIVIIFLGITFYFISKTERLLFLEKYDDISAKDTFKNLLDGIPENIVILDDSMQE